MREQNRPSVQNQRTLAGQAELAKLEFIDTTKRADVKSLTLRSTMERPQSHLGQIINDARSSIGGIPNRRKILPAWREHIVGNIY
jgi:hypothetical protein